MSTLERVGFSHSSVQSSLLTRFAVLFYYAKSAGKHSPHALVTSTPGATNISSLSKVGFQLFQYTRRGRNFTSKTRATSIFMAPHFALLLPHNFLTVLAGQVTEMQVSVSIGEADFKVFESLYSSQGHIKAAVEELLGK
ncbi:hypothetical protein AN958_02719 [Leucoagaricus sp. SymC.cos]|nr:hypothetical protein AN958_02719 [Leucoagaricus sp. SymC.cos]